jgi:hypothetical protein
VRAGFWCGDLRERVHSEDLGIDGRIILIWILSKRDGVALDWSGSGHGQVVGLCECGKEISGSIQFGEFLNQLRTR